MTGNGRASVLVIDDDPMVARVVVRCIGRDHDVQVVSDASHGLARIAAGATYDVILCDLMMPVMTGIQFHDELTNLRPEQLSAVVFMTGDAFTDASHEFLESVPNESIQKPFDAGALRALVDHRVK